MSKNGKHRKGYVELIVGNHQILHGFDVDNKEIIEEVAVDTPAKKLVAIDRILSVSEKFILTTYAFGRIVYWEYEGSYESIKEKLQQARKL
ncbi:hypothetical protein [Algoriphagus sp. NG3]|uniref:hypothetical protein n=1 Tax=Algoriphagus sp. NG3 TaxID=3097546 RepID=UPI002A7F5417|nr:hypothetical protein [Algoriphagus sp. NG3]WPR77147.1 hypothetical protein SLW71_07305 [Algoriphagus sp. NG3]